MSVQPEPGGEARAPVVVFSVDGERYALALGAVQEVRGADEAPAGVPGVAARRLLGLGGGAIDGAGGGRRALEFADDDARFFLEVDSVEGVTTIPTGALEPPPAYFDAATRELVAGLLADEEEMLIVLRAEMLLQRGLEALSG